MKTFQQIEQEMVENFVATTPSVTSLGVGSSVRGFITASALKIRELWYELTLVVRSLFIDTADGVRLDRRVGEMGITRRTGAKAGVLLLFTGDEGTVIPAGTVITNPTSGITYTTVQQIILGAKNADFVTSSKANIRSTIIGDIAWAECSLIGLRGNAPPNSLTRVNVSGVDSVTNPSAAQGGTDAESDDELRYRAKNYVKILNKKTPKYYEAICRHLNENVLRVFPQKDQTKPNAVKLTIVTKSGAPMTAPELTDIESKIKDYENAFTEIKCENITFTYISIKMRAKLKPIGLAPVNFEKYYTDAADILSKYYDWSKWEQGKDIRTDDTFVICKGIPQTDEIDLRSFTVNGSSATIIPVGNFSLPYFQSLEITNITTDTPTTLSNLDITQSYENLKVAADEL